MTTYKVPPMEKCSRCGGYGLRTNMIGEVDDCSQCGGSGEQEARDGRGRFLPWIVVEIDENATLFVEDGGPTAREQHLAFHADLGRRLNP